MRDQRRAACACSWHLDEDACRLPDEEQGLATVRTHVRRPHHRRDSQSQARGFGRIIRINAEVADRPQPHRSAYATAKSAQIG